MLTPPPSSGAAQKPPVKQPRGEHSASDRLELALAKDSGAPLLDISVVNHGGRPGSGGVSCNISFSGHFDPSTRTVHIKGFDGWGACECNLSVDISHLLGPAAAQSLTIAAITSTFDVLEEPAAIDPDPTKTYYPHDSVGRTLAELAAISDDEDEGKAVSQKRKLPTSPPGYTPSSPSYHVPW